MSTAATRTLACLHVSIWTPARLVPGLQRRLGEVGGTELDQDCLTLEWPDPSDGMPAVAGAFLLYHLLGEDLLPEVLGWWAPAASLYGFLVVQPCPHRLAPRWCA